uniref:Protein kinase domain-containing protein n=1 Tax=Zea mays TaxID=4577 RepID=A0A804PS50_MAIZE
MNNSLSLGKGGFGEVHKGTLPDKTEVAVKASNEVTQGEGAVPVAAARWGGVRVVPLAARRGVTSPYTVRSRQSLVGQPHRGRSPAAADIGRRLPTYIALAAAPCQFCVRRSSLAAREG